MKIHGCGTALVTPFTADGAVDERALRSLVDWQVQSGIRMLIACGSTAETPTLTEPERLRVIEIVIEAAAGRVPVIAGCTYNSTREAVERAQQYSAIRGLSALLSANPYYNKPTQEGQYQHFRAIAEASSLPVVLYNIPGRSGTNLEPATVLRLAEIENIIAVKESSGNLQQITEIAAAMPANFALLAGDDNIALPILAVGGAGLVSVVSNILPAEMSALVQAALDGDWSKAQELNSRLYRLVLANFWEPNPIPVKYLLAKMGRIQLHYRLPLTPATAATKQRLEKIGAEYGLF